MSRLFAALSLVFGFLVSAPLFAECVGHNLFDSMDPARRAEVQAAADAVPFAKGNFWRATKGDQVITLAGTYHFDDPRHAANLAALMPAITGATTVLVEAAPEAEKQLKSQIAKDPGTMVITEGPTLNQQLPPDVWKELSEAMSARGIPAFMTAKFKPWYVLTLLSIPPCAMLEMKGEPEGLDRLVIKVAEEARVPVQSLEPYDTLFKIFGSLTEAELTEMLVSTLAIEPQGEGYFNTLVDSYFAGESRAAWELMRFISYDLPGYTHEQVDAEFARMEEIVAASRNRAFGTSAAAPHVAGVAALLMEAKKKYYNNVSFTGSEMKTLLKTSALAMDSTGIYENGGSGFVQADKALQTFSNPYPQVTGSYVQDSSKIPGTDTVTVVIDGKYFAGNASVIFQYDTIPAVVTNGTQLVASIPPFFGNPPLTVYNPPISPSGLDGGNSDSLYFFGTIPKNVVVTVNDATKHYEDLIREALLLSKLLIDNPHTQQPETFALMALMCFHSSRSESRLTATGEIILLPNQNRTKWNNEMLEHGNYYINKAAYGNALSTYHLEAAIAYEHCTSPSFDKTNWKLILNYYEMLCKISLSPATLLNKIAVVMHLHGPLVALQQLEEMNDNKKLETIYLYYGLLGELNLRLNRREESKRNFEKAISLTQSPSEKALLSSKIAVMFN